MRAALVLTLEDKLKAGLKSTEDGLTKLKQIGKDITLGKLEDALKPINEANNGIRRMTHELRQASNQAGQLEGRLARVGASIQGLGARMARGLFGRHGPPNPNERGGLVGAGEGLAAGIAVAAPILKFADFEDALRHIAITSNLTGAGALAEIARLTKLINREALEGSQSSKSVAEAYYGLLTGGAGTPAQVEEALRAHTQAATAYKIKPEDFTPVTLTLMKNFKITGEEMGKALAAVGQAAKEGQLKVPDYARSLPEVAGQFASHGMIGLANANYAIAALQTLRQDAGEAGEAHTRLNELMSTLYSKSGKLHFALVGRNDFAEERARVLMRKATGHDGLDISGLIESGAKQGLNPIESIVQKLLQIKGKLSGHEFSDLMAAMVTDQTAMKGWMSLINHREFFEGLRTKLTGIDPNQVSRDFKTASEGPEGGVRRVGEGMEQLVRRAGEGFAGILAPLDSALQGMVGWIDKVDDGHKGLVDTILGVTAGMAGLGAALAAIGFVAPAVAGGAALVGGAALPALAAGTILGIPAYVGYGIYKHWGDGGDYTDPSFAPEFGTGPLMTQADWDARHPARPPSRPWSWVDEGSGAPWAPHPAAPWAPVSGAAPNGTLEINIHTDAGTQAEVGRPPGGIMINTHTNPGQTLGRP